MTTPTASGTLYASVTDLRDVLSSTDGGTGTAAQLSDEQLTLALYAASNRISVYAGNVYDGSTQAATPPPILHDLALDMAAFWATKTYLKNKEIPTTSPVWVAYQNAEAILQDVRAGKIELAPSPAPGVGPDVGTIINRIPQTFTGYDSNTRLDPITGTLEADSPFWTPRTGGLVDGGPVYQG